jgi:hypothetical protein
MSMDEVGRYKGGNFANTTFEALRDGRKDKRRGQDAWARLGIGLGQRIRSCLTKHCMFTALRWRKRQDHMDFICCSKATI